MTISIISPLRSLNQSKPFFFSRTKLLFFNYRFRERWRQQIDYREVCLSISVHTLSKFAMYYRHYIESARSCKIDGRHGEWGRELSCEKKRDKADRPSPMIMAVVWWWLIEFFNVAFLQYFLPYSITVHSIAICSARAILPAFFRHRVLSGHVNETFTISRKRSNIKVKARKDNGGKI